MIGRISRLKLTGSPGAADAMEVQNNTGIKSFVSVIRNHDHYRYLMPPPFGPAMATSIIYFITRALTILAEPTVPTDKNEPNDLLFAYIRQNEYTGAVQSLLRAHKAIVFQALGHPTRIAIVETLRDGELAAGSIQERLGVEQANLSQHLAILRSRQIVANRREGNQVFYSLRSPVLVEVLDIMKRYFHAHLSETTQMLSEIEAEHHAR